MNKHLTRVKSRIGEAVELYVKETPSFYASELREYVESKYGQIAPGSADCILRDLRQRGIINYRVINRRASLYESLPTEEQ